MRYAEACEWLQLDPRVSLDESKLRTCFKKAAIREHPDKSSADDANHRFQQVNHARQYLLKCVARGETGMNAYEEDDDANKDDDDDYYYDEDKDDMEDFFHMPVFSFHIGPHGEIFIRVHASGRGGGGPSFSSGPSFSGSTSSSNFGSRSSSYREPRPSPPPPVKTREEQRAENKKKREQAEEREYEEYMERMYQHAKDQEQARQKLKKREEERAEREDLLKQQQLKKELKREAPLVDEWAEVTDTTNMDLNGNRVRVTDYFDGMYTVQWSVTKGSGKKVKQHVRKARIKPEHLRLTVTLPVNANKTDSAVPQQARSVPAAAAPPKGPKMIKMKVKCPKDKKAGDVFEVKNPHNHGKYVTVRVPPKTIPGKSFAWMVQAAEQAPEQVVRCAVCSRGLKDDPTTVALRSCPHSVCQGCAPLVESKCCMVCNEPKPTVTCFLHMAYIQELQAPELVVEKLLEEYFCSKESDAAKSTEHAGKAMETLGHASEQATKAVNRHYRKTSIKLHPDRNGEAFRPQFELFTKAKQVMIDPELRRSYIEAMLEIVCKVDLGYLPRAHQYWIDKHATDDDEDSRHKKGEAGQKEKHLQLDGGVMYNKPKKPQVVIRDKKERLIEVALPVANEYQFLSYCHEAIIVGSSDNSDDKEIRLAKVSRENIHVTNGEILVKLILTEHAMWDIKWYIRIDPGDERRIYDTPASEEATIDLRSEKQLRALKQMDMLHEWAKQRVHEIKAKLRNSTSLGRQETETRYWDLHRVISKGRSLETRLRVALDSVGDTSNTELVSLHDILEEATVEKAKLEELFEGYVKKDARKNFKAKVAEILEKGVAANWLENVSNNELKKMGAEANRLYQLLIEGKKANSLVLDGETLLAASKRSDLFSTKQCEVLLKRGEEVEKEFEEKASRAVEEARKVEEAEKERLEMEAMANLMPRGTLVRIHGLESQIHLNGKLATFIGVGQNKRYIIRIFDGKDISLKQSNFSEWDESHFGNADDTNEEDKAPKHVDPSSDSLGRTASSNKDNGNVGKSSKPLGSHRMNAQDKQPVKPAVSVKKQPANETCKSNVGTARQISPSSHTNPQQGPKYSHTQQNIGSQSITMPHSQRPTAPESQAPPRRHTNGIYKPVKLQTLKPIGSERLNMPPNKIISEVMVNGEADTRSQNSSRQSKNGRRCNRGVHCHFLRQAPNSCKYVHSPEEIAQVHSPMDVATSKPVSQPVQHPPHPVHSPAIGEDSPTLASPEEKLFTFLSKHEDCFKCSVGSVYLWLQSEDIVSLVDLSDAVDDTDYVDSELTKNGLKKFKRGAFKIAVKNAAVAQA